MNYLEFVKNANSNEIKELKKAFEIKEQTDKLWKSITNKKFTLDNNVIKKGQILLWSDSNNKEFIKIVHTNQDKLKFIWVAEYLHQRYEIELDYEVLFKLMMKDDRGVQYLKTYFFKKEI